MTDPLIDWKNKLGDFDPQRFAAEVGTETLLGYSLEPDVDAVSVQECIALTRYLDGEVARFRRRLAWTLLPWNRDTLRIGIAELIALRDGPRELLLELARALRAARERGE